MRLIDADALLDEICHDQCERKYKDCDGTCEIAAYVVNAPTVDADTNEKEQWFEDWDLTPETASQVLQNYSAFLCSMTGGKLSKIGYDLKTMETVANDYWNMLIDEGITEYKMSNGGNLK